MPQYKVIFAILLCSFLLGSILQGLGYFLVQKTLNYEKISAYECGFDPFGVVHKTFDIRYYLISILFIIFDIEISFLFPWSIVFLYIGFLGYVTMIIFLVILTFGFVYEWVNKALDWNLVGSFLGIFYFINFKIDRE
jgi:NADH:ubiquinone oxidoreductase subunit 3 (subunit A)